MFTYFVVGILSAALSAVVLTGGRTVDLTDFEGHLALVAVVLSGVLGGTMASAIWQYCELRRLRAMTDFFNRLSPDERDSIQNMFDGVLTALAIQVRTGSEKLILLQQDGLRTQNPNVNATNAEGLSSTFDNVKGDLLAQFKEAQGQFYKTYDRVASFTRYLFVTLKGRDWENYAGKPKLGGKMK